jgi:hypothetical protein
LGLPSFALMTFGCYSLFKIGGSLRTLKDYPESHKSLLEDIVRAKENLTKKGFKF